MRRLDVLDVLRLKADSPSSNELTFVPNVQCFYGHVLCFPPSEEPRSKAAQQRPVGGDMVEGVMAVSLRGMKSDGWSPQARK